MAGTQINVQKDGQNIVIITDNNNSTNVSVAQRITNVVDVIEIGPQGPSGADGISGSQGPKGDPGQIELFDDLVVTGSLSASGNFIMGLGNQRNIQLKAGSQFLGTRPVITSDFSQIEFQRDIFMGLNGGIGSTVPSKIFFDTSDTFIAADQENPENLEIHADNDIELRPDGIVHATSIISASGFTGSLEGTASFANDALSSSFATTASHAVGALSSSFATTASFALNVPPQTGFPFTGSAEISGSLDVNGPITASGLTLQGILNTNNNNINTGEGEISSDGGFNGDLSGTASFALNVDKALGDLKVNQDLTVVGSASISGSLELGSTGVPTISSDSNLVLSASEKIDLRGSVTSSIGFTGSLEGTASFATSASFSTTASYALNAGSGVGFPFTGSAEISGSLDIVGPITSSGTISSSGGFTGSLEGTASFSNEAEIAEYTSEWVLTADGSNHYIFTGPGFTGSVSDPNIYLIRGQKYKFTNNMGAHPFRIQSTENGATGTQYNNGVTNNDVSNGTLLFDVPMNAPEILYYQCTAHGNMGGPIYISHPISASFATTASHALHALTASYVEGSSSLFVNGVPSSDQLTIWHNNNTLKGSNRLKFDGSAFILTTPTVFNNDNDDQSALQAKGSGDDNLLQVNPTYEDKIGIGTALPTEKLTVIGNISASGAVTASAFMGDGSGLTGINSGSGTGFPFSGSAVITGSMVISGSSTSLTITGSTNQQGNINLQGSLTSSGGVIVYENFISGSYTRTVQLIPGNLIAGTSPRLTTSEDTLAFTKDVKLSFVEGSVTGSVGTPTILKFFGDNINLTPILNSSPSVDNDLKIQSPGIIILSSTNVSASGAITASAFKGDGSALTGINNPGFPFTGSAIITGSLDVIGPLTASIISSSEITGSLLGTASFADDATSASFATTASHAVGALSSSFATTASFALNANSNAHLGLPIFTYITTSLNGQIPNAGEFLDADATFDTITFSSESKDGVLLANSNGFFNRLPGSTYTIIETSSGAFIAYKSRGLYNDYIGSGSLGYTYVGDESSTSGSINSGDTVYLRLDKSANVSTFHNLEDPDLVLDGKILASLIDDTFNYLDLKFGNKDGSTFNGFFTSGSQEAYSNMLLAPAISKSADLKLNSVTASLDVAGDIDMDGGITASGFFAATNASNAVRGLIGGNYSDATTNFLTNIPNQNPSKGIVLNNYNYGTDNFVFIDLQTGTPSGTARIAVVNPRESGSADIVFVSNANEGASKVFYEQARITHSGSLHLTKGIENAISASGTGSFKHLTLDYDAMPSSDPGVKGVVYRNASNQLFISTGSA